MFSYLYFLMHCFYSKKLTEIAFNKKEKGEAKDIKSKMFFKGGTLNGGIDLAKGPGHRVSRPVFSEDL